jgi:polyhydroxyalkanoate synthesis repressor PhaR
MMSRDEKRTETNEERILIKKYGNRRLYLIAISSYITLSELEEMVHAGQSIQVIDANTKEDITAQVLTQILVEGGKAKSIPVGFLEKIIRQRSDLLDSLLTVQTQQLERSVDVARQAQDEFFKMMQRAMQVGGMWNPFSSGGEGRVEHSSNQQTNAQRVADLERELRELKDMIRKQNQDSK